jgi:hypothetical protein
MYVGDVEFKVGDTVEFTRDTQLTPARKWQITSIDIDKNEYTLSTNDMFKIPDFALLTENGERATVIANKIELVSSFLGYQPTSPDYVPRSPDYVPRTPDYVPRSPDYVPRSPDNGPTSPDNGPTSPDNGPTSPDNGPGPDNETREEPQIRTGLNSPDSPMDQYLPPRSGETDEQWRQRTAIYKKADTESPMDQYLPPKTGGASSLSKPKEITILTNITDENEKIGGSNEDSKSNDDSDKKEIKITL